MKKDEQEVSIELRTREEYMSKHIKTPEALVFTAIDFINAITKKEAELKKKGIKPKVIVLRSWGYSCLAHYIKAEGHGEIANINDTGNKKIYDFRGLTVVNISQDGEENIISPKQLNFVEVYGD